MRRRTPLDLGTPAPLRTGELWDFVVVGAGPAGSRAAELLAEGGHSVLLLDPKAPWEKPCGGGLTAAAVRHLPELGELEQAGRWVRELSVAGPGGARMLVPLAEPYLVVSRRALSAWGLKRAQVAGAHFLRVGACSVDRWARGWRVTDQRGEVHRARWLVGADGAASRLRTLLAPELKPELAPTRVAYPGDGVRPGVALFQFLSSGEGYLWDFARRGHHSVGIAVPPHRFPREALDGAIAQYRLAEFGDSAPPKPVGAVIATANWGSGRFEDLGGYDYALLGDAAGLADPATGEGIDYAFRSADLAVSAFCETSGFSCYPEAARRAFAHEYRRALLVRRWLYAPRVADGLIRWAGRSHWGAALLAALANAVNEHRSLRRAIARGLLAWPRDSATSPRRPR